MIARVACDTCGRGLEWIYGDPVCPSCPTEDKPRNVEKLLAQREREAVVYLTAYAAAQMAGIPIQDMADTANTLHMRRNQNGMIHKQDLDKWLRAREQNV